MLSKDEVRSLRYNQPQIALLFGAFAPKPKGFKLTKEESFGRKSYSAPSNAAIVPRNQKVSRVNLLYKTTGKNTTSAKSKIINYKTNHYEKDKIYLLDLHRRNDCRVRHGFYF
jgi:hypothetical protein